MIFGNIQRQERIDLLVLRRGFGKIKNVACVGKAGKDEGQRSSRNSWRGRGYLDDERSMRE